MTMSTYTPSKDIQTLNMVANILDALAESSMSDELNHFVDAVATDISCLIIDVNFATMAAKLRAITLNSPTHRTFRGAPLSRQSCDVLPTQAPSAPRPALRRLPLPQYDYLDDATRLDKLRRSNDFYGPKVVMNRKLLSPRGVIIAGIDSQADSLMINPIDWSMKPVKPKSDTVADPVLSQLFGQWIGSLSDEKTNAPIEKPVDAPLSKVPKLDLSTITMTIAKNKDPAVKALRATLRHLGMDNVVLKTFVFDTDKYPKSVLVTGNTKPHRPFLSEGGGQWNADEGSWVFSRKKVLKAQKKRLNTTAHDENAVHESCTHTSDFVEDSEE